MVNKDSYQEIELVDSEIAAALLSERKRQDSTIQLIASENFVSKAVLAAQGSVATNKYAEGLPGSRYYGGCDDVDKIESLAIGRVKKLFSADFAISAGQRLYAGHVFLFLTRIFTGTEPKSSWERS